MNKEIDCNNCIHLNLTEQQQRELKDNSRWHKCELYNSQVLHLSNKVNHNPKLYPCQECKEDKYINYEESYTILKFDLQILCSKEGEKHG